MNTIYTGLFIALIGGGNLYTGRKHPERINARLLRGMGCVGIVVGLLVSLGGLLSMLTPPR